MGTQTLNMQALDAGGNMTYPGGIMVAGASVTAKVTGDNAYDFTYKINATIDTDEWTGSSTSLTWKLYEVSGEVEGPLFSGCALSDTGLGKDPKEYYYENCAANETITTGDLITTGSVTAGETASKTFDITAGSLKFTDISSSTGAGQGETKKFYLVVEYPSEGDQTTTDAGHNVSLKINSITEAKATLHTA